MVHKEKIIAILDLDTARTSQISRNFINNIMKSGLVQNIAENGKEKSLIISDKEYYLSPISSSTLLKRSSSNNVFETM